MNMEQKFIANCNHVWEWKDVELSAGPNVFAQEVACWGKNGTCTLCMGITWVLVRPDERFTIK